MIAAGSTYRSGDIYLSVLTVESLTALNILQARSSTAMIEGSESFETRSSGDLWSEICSSLPEPEEQGPNDGQFTDSFQPPSQESNQNSTSPSATFSPWEPMADSEVYIATLENRLKRIKGQSSEVTSREMLRSLSQAKKECWDRFLHDAQTSELFQEGDLDQSALEQLKRWLSPERVAINAEELEYLLLPSQSRERVAAQHSSSTDHTAEEPEEEESSSPEK
ncbi:coiled-coil domain-containing protein 32 isoform X1 [Colossoma macropomum]|uniref:coiled-coil domain-containing protein 32 isoform X1 n=2 Tax=Colossoma macropomum TaxID=42526 RepID=UPI0018643182|nr:coiled-coil domain-containing protein 32 isoform X1 [Colossoma macropomum]